MNDSKKIICDYCHEQGRQLMLEEIIEALETSGSQLSGPYRDGWLAALESIRIKK